MPVPKLQDVRSVDEFRRLYYPAAEPALDYFDGVGPQNGRTEEDETGPVIADPLDLFGRIVSRDA